MSTHEINPEARFQCRHILTDGRRCRAACLRHEEFCYYHHASRKPVDDPIGRRSRRHSFTLPRMDDHASLQAALNDVVARIAANGIDSYRAGRLLYAIQLASCILPRRPAAKPIDPAQESGPVERVVHHPDYGEIAPRFALSGPELSKDPEAPGPPEDRNDNQSGDPQTALQQQLDTTREQLESHEDRMHAMHAELTRCREDLAKAQAQAAEAREDTLRAEKGMVWHMDRQHEALAELEALKLAIAPAPLDDAESATLDVIQAVAQLPLSSFDEVGGPAFSHMSRKKCHPERVPHPFAASSRKGGVSSEARPLFPTKPRIRIWVRHGFSRARTTNGLAAALAAGVRFRDAGASSTARLTTKSLPNGTQESLKRHFSHLPARVDLKRMSVHAREIWSPKCPSQCHCSSSPPSSSSISSTPSSS